MGSVCIYLSYDCYCVYSSQLLYSVHVSLFVVSPLCLITQLYTLTRLLLLLLLFVLSLLLLLLLVLLLLTYTATTTAVSVTYTYSGGDADDLRAADGPLLADPVVRLLPRPTPLPTLRAARRQRGLPRHPCTCCWQLLSRCWLQLQ